MPNDTDSTWQSRLAAWLAMGAAFAAVYLGIAHLGLSRWVVPRLPWERALPAYANALPIYVSVLPVTLAACLATRALGRLVLAFAGVLAFAAICFLALPMQVDRPQMIVGWAPLREALLALRSADGAGNALPSLHVAIATLCALHLRHRLWLLWLLAVAASTILVGQHALVDGAAGLVLGASAYYGTCRTIRPRSSSAR